MTDVKAGDVPDSKGWLPFRNAAFEDDQGFVTGDLVVQHMVNSLFFGARDKEADEVVGFTVRIPKTYLKQIDDMASSFGFSRNWLCLRIIEIGLQDVNDAYLKMNEATNYLGEGKPDDKENTK